MTQIKQNFIDQNTWLPEMAVTKIDSTLPSMTVPDMGYTIQELIERHRSGLLTDLAQPAIYYDDQDFDSPDVEKLKHQDLQDQHEFIQNSKQQIKLFNKQQKEAAAKAKGSAASVATQAATEPPAAPSERKQGEPTT